MRTRAYIKRQRPLNRSTLDVPEVPLLSTSGATGRPKGRVHLRGIS